MWQALTGIAEAMKYRPALLAVVVIALVQLGMVWRRRGARHTARMINDGRTPAFDLLVRVTARAQYGCLAIAGIQELGIQAARVLKAIN